MRRASWPGGTTPRSVTIARHQLGRRHVEGRIPGGDAVGAAALTPRHPVTSSVPAPRSGSPSRPATAGSTVEHRGQHVERHAVRPRGEREAIGADLVRDVAVGGDPVGADHRAGDVAQPQAARDHAVGDHRALDAGAAQLPGGEPAALEQRPGLRHHHPRRPAGPVEIVDRRQRGADAAGGEHAGIADRGDGGPVGNQLARRARRSARTSRGPRPRSPGPRPEGQRRRSSPVRGRRLGPPLHPAGAPSAGSPRWAGSRRAAATARRNGLEPSSLPSRDRHAHRRRDPDQRRASNPQRLDRLDDRIHRRELQVPLLAGQQRLVEQPDAAGRGPGDRSWKLHGQKDTLELR